MRKGRVASARALLALLLGLSGYTATPQSDLDSIVILDELRSAFYEHAPARLARQMTQAVRAACQSDAERSRIAAPVPWLCAGGRLVYFRNVYINGHRGAHGLVCRPDMNYTFIGVDQINDLADIHTCVAAERDETAYRLLLEFPAADTGR